MIVAPLSPEVRFWRWFSDHAAELAAVKSGVEPVLDKLSSALEAVHPDLTFEIGPEVNKKREFVISADGVKAGFPAVRLLVESAPALAGWTVIAFRQPRDSLTTIQLGELRLSTNDIWFSMAADGSRVGLTLYIRGLTPENEEPVGQAAFILLDSVLGEYDVETRIGAIQRRPLPADLDCNGLCPLVQLREMLRASWPYE